NHSAKLLSCLPITVPDPVMVASEVNRAAHSAHIAARRSPPRAVRAMARVPVRRPARSTSQPKRSFRNRLQKRTRSRRGGLPRSFWRGSGGGRGDVGAVGGESLIGVHAGAGRSPNVSLRQPACHLWRRKNVSDEARLGRV